MRGKLGLLFGVVAGATLGILFAPKKGSELRKNIQESKGKGYDVFKENFKMMGDEMYKFSKEIYSSKEFQDQIKKGKVEVQKYAALAKKKGKEYLELAEKYHKKATKEGMLKAKEYKQKADMYMDEAKKFAKMKQEEFTEEIKKQATKAEKTAKKKVKKVIKKATKK